MLALSASPHPEAVLQVTWTLSGDNAFKAWERLQLHAENVTLFLESESTEIQPLQIWKVQVLVHPDAVHPNQMDPAWWNNLVSAEAPFSEAPEVTWLLPKNWLLENQKLLSPIRVGSFYIHTASYPASSELGVRNLQVEAATAFGSGYHATTQGCLQCLEDLWTSDPWTCALDLGCGSGILTLAMNALSPRSAVGVDCDPESVRVSRENAEINQIPSLFWHSEGFEHSAIQKPFDLIVANIMAGPLIALAPVFSRFGQCHGILSGITLTQAPDVINAYGQHGWTITRQRDKEDWSTLWLTRTF